MNVAETDCVDAKDAIRLLRTQLDESQAEFAGRFGLKQRVISYYEHGLGYPKPRVARKLAELATELGLDYDLGIFLER